MTARAKCGVFKCPWGLWWVAHTTVDSPMPSCTWTTLTGLIGLGKMYKYKRIDVGSVLWSQIPGRSSK